MKSRSFKNAIQNYCYMYIFTLNFKAVTFDLDTKAEKMAGNILESTHENKYLSHLVEKPTIGFPNRSDTNRPVKLQKQARSLKFWS